jgi:hypothetical protein
VEVLRRCKRPDAGANPHGTMGAEELERAEGDASVCAIWHVHTLKVCL